MRILHTSDWHLGQNFYSKSRAAEHQAFLDWLLASAQEHDVDAIIVAGDIFDHRPARQRRDARHSVCEVAAIVRHPEPRGLMWFDRGYHTLMRPAC